MSTLSVMPLLGKGYYSKQDFPWTRLVANGLFIEAIGGASFDRENVVN